MLCCRRLRARADEWVGLHRWSRRDVPAMGAEAWFGWMVGVTPEPPFEPAEQPQFADLIEQVVTSAGRLVGVPDVLLYLVEPGEHGGRRLVVRCGIGCLPVSARGCKGGGCRVRGFPGVVGGRGLSGLPAPIVAWYCERATGSTVGRRPIAQATPQAPLTRSPGSGGSGGGAGRPAGGRTCKGGRVGGRVLSGGRGCRPGQPGLPRSADRSGGPGHPAT